eukprot:comp4684_c0_seq1/m.854 comp4684_c0_seq1/g.854  ORF comp4684_c0_seq1/g.854 comp4684_c0_seq1/m.854 type:complete len:318 (-) comp4684_c0_seq1:118-1071(-)
MIRVPKAKNARTKRFLENRAPKVVENPKNTLFLKGAKTGDAVAAVLHDLHGLKKPNAIVFKKKNPIHPFEDATSLEFFAQKNDTSLFVFGSHSKKRPSNLVIGRMFDHHLLDMVEFGVGSVKSVTDFKAETTTLGAKPCFLFNGDLFETNNELQKIKLLLLDFFRGENVSAVNLQGIEHVISVTATAENTIAFRTYRISLLKSGVKTPRVELVDLGPHMDLTVRRAKWAANDVMKEAMRVPKELKPTKAKNISYDSMGNKQARIHMEKQDLGTMQTRKMKGLKRSPEEIEAEAKPKQINPGRQSKKARKEVEDADSD